MKIFTGNCKQYYMYCMTHAWTDQNVPTYPLEQVSHNSDMWNHAYWVFFITNSEMPIILDKPSDPSTLELTPNTCNDILFVSIACNLRIKSDSDYGIKNTTAMFFKIFFNAVIVDL